DPSLMQVSYGDLPMPENIQMEWEKLDENVAELRLTWDVPARDHKSDFSMYDQAMVVVYDPRQETEAEGILHGAFRNTGNETLIFNYSAENEYHVWIAFLSADRERQSHSLYMGVITETGQENLADESALEEAYIQNNFLNSNDLKTERSNKLDACYFFSIFLFLFSFYYHAMGFFSYHRLIAKPGI